MFKYNELAIRPIERDDLDFLMRLRRESWKTLGTIDMPTKYKQDKWFDSIQASNKCNYYIIEKDYKGQLLSIGLARTDEIDTINRSIRVGLDIVKSERDKGLGTESMRMIVKYCFDYLNMNRLWLLVIETNKNALAVYKKVGFKEEGKQIQGIYRDGKYLDYIMMSLIRDDYEI